MLTVMNECLLVDYPTRYNGIRVKLFTTRYGIVVALSSSFFHKCKGSTRLYEWCVGGRKEGGNEGRKEGRKRGGEILPISNGEPPI